MKKRLRFLMTKIFFVALWVLFFFIIFAGIDEFLYKLPYWIFPWEHESKGGIAALGSLTGMLFIYMGYKFHKLKHWSLFGQSIINRDLLIDYLDREFNLLQRLTQLVEQGKTDISSETPDEYSDIHSVISDLKEVKAFAAEARKRFWSQLN